MQSPYPVQQTGAQTPPAQDVEAALIIVQVAPQAPQLPRAFIVSVHIPAQFVVVPPQLHVPVPSQTPPVGLPHAPDVRGTALHVVAVPTHMISPLVTQLPVPGEVHGAPTPGTQTPPQFVYPGLQLQPQTPAVQVVVALVPAVGQTFPHDPQLEASDAVLVHVPAQSVGVAPAQTQVPAVKHTPPAGLVHACPPDNGTAPHVVPTPAQTVMPDCWHPPAPEDVHAAPADWQTPPQLSEVGPAQAQVPVPSHVPPEGSVQPPEVRGVALHTNLVPEQTYEPLARQLLVPEVHGAPSVPATQTPPQETKPLLHDEPQVPAVQVAVAPIGALQACPHPPQFATLVEVSAQAPAQSVGAEPPQTLTQPKESGVVPAGAHTGVAPRQPTPQLPQCAGCERSASQPFAGLPSQSAKPTAHAEVHAPPAQAALECGGVVQAASHEPQFARSDAKSTQRPWQTAPRIPAQSHRPPMQLMPAGQTRPQPPQLRGSVVTSIHIPAQSR